MSEARQIQNELTYEDYLASGDEDRWELIDGQAWAMSPGPTFRHQTLVGNIFVQLSLQLKGKKCRPMVAPLDVRLTEKAAKGKEKTHVVQPDVLVFCDPEKADDKGLNGAPDWVLEVLSESTAWKDTSVKLELYRRFGVREYWILNPETKLLLVYILKDGSYGLPKPYLGNVMVPVSILPGVEIELAGE